MVTVSHIRARICYIMHMHGRIWKNASLTPSPGEESYLNLIDQSHVKELPLSVSQDVIPSVSFIDTCTSLENAVLHLVKVFQSPVL